MKIALEFIDRRDLQRRLEQVGMCGATLNGDVLTVHFMNRDEIWRRCDRPVDGEETIRFDGQWYRLSSIHDYREES